MEGTHLKFSKLCYTAVGFWPIKTKRKAIFVFYNYCYFGFCAFMAVSFVLSLILELWIMKNDIKAFTNNFAIGLCFSFSLIQVRSCTWPTARLLWRKIEVTERNIIKNGTPEVKMVYMRELKRYDKLFIFFGLTALICDAVYTVTPWISNYLVESDDSDRLMLPVESWLPFDKYVYYKTAFAYEFTGGMCITGFTVASYYFYFGVMQFSLTQFTILKCKIMKDTNHRLGEYEVQENVRKIVIYYNNIILFVQQLDQVLHYIMMGGSTIFIAEVAILAFQVTTENLSVNLIRSGILLYSMLFQLFVYYWLANEITLKNSSITDGIWESDWYNCSTSVKKSLQLIMMRSQRPLQLSVGPFYYMNNETMVKILKTSITYAGALRKFHMMSNGSD